MKIPLILAALLTTVALRAETELKGNPNELKAYLAGLPSTVSISGESDVKVVADRAKVTLKVRTENKSLVDSLRMNQEMRGKVASLLKEGGISADQIQAARFSSTQKFGVFSEKAKSYVVDNFLKVTVRDEKEFQAVAGAVDRWSEVHFLGIEFEHTGKEAVKARAKAQACDMAEERRKLYESKFGVKLVAKGFTEATAPTVPVNNAVYGSSVGSLSKGYERDTQLPGGNLDASVGESGSPFGELTYTAKVIVSYVVESK
ncbi:MAG: SIMPL domain-containing protein [Verrucomicrobia bacterium]|nr:SIMPL domain-containing protein [Verrucomicrobiota bacterium]